MRLLVYTDDSGHGGTAVHTELLARGLAARGLGVFLATGGLPGRPLPGVARLDIGYDPMLLFEKSAASLDEPLAVLDAAAPDMVLFSDSSPRANLAAKAAAARAGLPGIMVCNFASPSLAGALGRHMEAVHRAYQEAAAVVAVSGENLSVLRRCFGAPQERSRVIPYGRPEAFFAPPAPSARETLRAALGLSATDVLCFTAARYERRKGYHVQLAAMARLAGRPAFARLRFAWAGHGGPQALAELAVALREHGLDGKVLLLGQRGDIRELLAAADLFVLPSEAEGLPLSIIEAMAAGLPVVASAVGGIPEQLGPAGVLLPDPLADPDAAAAALASALEALARDGAARLALGRAARERASRLYSEARMVGAYADLIGEVAASCPAGPAPCPRASRTGVRLPGRTMDFRPGGEALELVREGFADAETEGSWTVGSTARLAGGPGGPLALWLGMRPLAARGAPPLEVGARVGPVTAGPAWRLRAGEPDAPSLVFLLPPSAGRGAEDVRLTVSGAVSPASLGLSPDTRELGLFCETIRFEALPPSSLLPPPLLETYLSWMRGKKPLPGREPGLPRFVAWWILEGRGRQAGGELPPRLFPLADLPSTLPAAPGWTAPTMLMRELLDARADVAERFNLERPEGVNDFLGWFFLFGLAEHGMQERLDEEHLDCLAQPADPKRPAGAWVLNRAAYAAWRLDGELRRAYDPARDDSREALARWFATRGPERFPVAGLLARRSGIRGGGA